MESVECRECIYDVQKDIADRKSLRTPDKMAGFFFFNLYCEIATYKYQVTNTQKCFFGEKEKEKTSSTQLAQVCTQFFEFVQNRPITFKHMFNSN